jgi:DMSO/TMAO reductase YedYZ molybdopterin-dependent catalytic subunit
VTHSLAASQEQVEISTWRLALDGAVAVPLLFTYEQLLARKPSEQVVTLDCTLGWYTDQAWQGLPLAELLEEAGVSPRAVAVRLESVTGYAQILPLSEARQALLATHVGGEPLDLSHGYPLRSVAPSRRGWFWVKWLARVEVIAV